MGWLIDTSLWLAVERGALAAADIHAITGQDPVYLSPVNVAEIRFGLELLRPGAECPTASGDGQMQLGNFSVSLAVKDIAAARAFYEKLGFKWIAGDQSQNWLILQNSTNTIGLFQGPQYTRNMLTFNPGWDRTGSTLPDFDDVREIQRTLKGRGLVPTAAADESSTGPASMVLTDPDGNPILIDQHVPKPRK